jgi:hypothetical protein
MVKKTVLLFCLVLLTLASLSAITAIRNGFITINGGREIVALQMSGGHLTPAQDDAKLQTIAGNLNIHHPYGLYFCCFGWTASGPNGGNKQMIWLAVPFTPSANATVKKVEAAMGYIGGTNEVVLSVNSDNSGLPGAAIATFHIKNVPVLGACCKLATGTSAAGIPVTQGTQYWLVVSTDSHDADFFGVWDWSTTDMRSYPSAINPDGTWRIQNGVLPAYAVLGN